MQVEQGSLVQIAYRLSAEERGVFGGTRPGETLQFVFGEHPLPLGLDRRIEGLAVGARAEGTFVMPEKFAIPSSEASRFAAQVEDEEQLGYSVEEVRGEVTVVRPTLAGEEVSYSIRVVDVIDSDRTQRIAAETLEVESDGIDVLNAEQLAEVRERKCGCHMANCFLLFGYWLFSY